MLAVAGIVPEPIGDFAYEVKWDGARTILMLDGVGGLRLLSRTGADLTARFPEIAPLSEALAGRDAVLDGELVAFGADGRPDFAGLQQRLHLARPAAIAARERTHPVTLVLFDVLWLDGRDLTARSFLDRRAALESLQIPLPSVRVPPIWIGESAPAIEFTRRNALEGVIAKRLTSHYTGARSRNWIKIKHVSHGSFVIGGWVPAAGTASSVKALLVGERVGRRLRFAAAVGSGFAHAERRALAGLLEPLRAADSPFA